MRLIDADELKKCAIPCEIHNGALTDMCVPLYQVDNAPTVKPYCYFCGQKEHGQTVERPKGEWIIVKDEKYGDNVKCPFCGKELAGTDLNFCCKCGAKLTGSEKMNGGKEE